MHCHSDTCRTFYLSPPVEHVIYGMEISKWHNWFHQRETDMQWFPDREFDENQDLWALQIDYRHSIGFGSYVSDRFVVRHYEGLVIVPVQSEHKSWSRRGLFRDFCRSPDSSQRTSSRNVGQRAGCAIRMKDGKEPGGKSLYEAAPFTIVFIVFHGNIIIRSFIFVSIFSGRA